MLLDPQIYVNLYAKKLVKEFNPFMNQSNKMLTYKHLKSYTNYSHNQVKDA